MVCERSEIVAYACAISRAFPIYDQKTKTKCDQRVEVGFIPVGGDSAPLSQEEVKCLNALCEGVRLAQEIVDMPTNLMHTDAFLDVRMYCVQSCMDIIIRTLTPGPSPT